MNKKFLAFFLLLSAACPQIYASRFGDGFGVGAVTGFVGGLIGSKIAANSPPTVYVMDDPYVQEKREELRWQEDRLRAAQLEQRRRERALELQRRAEARYLEERCAQNKLCNGKEVTIIETKKIAKPKDFDLRQRELALKEQQTQLAIIKEKKELLREQNRQAKLALKKKELELKLLESKSNQDRNIDFEKQKITRKFSKIT